jgi:hypothetical protein
LAKNQPEWYVHEHPVCGASCIDRRDIGRYMQYGMAQYMPNSSDLFDEFLENENLEAVGLDD